MTPISDLSRSSPTKTKPATPVLGRLRVALLVFWAAASFGTCYFARDLQFGAAGRGMAYEVAGQGLLIVFIVLVVINAVVFNRRGGDEDSAADSAGSGG